MPKAQDNPHEGWSFVVRLVESTHAKRLNLSASAIAAALAMGAVLARQTDIPLWGIVSMTLAVTTTGGRTPPRTGGRKKPPTTPLLGA